MFTVSVRDHFMIAHSFRGEVFGPAQRLHGATYVVDTAFRRPDLDSCGIVVDIGRAAAVLKGILDDLNFRNLDDDPQFKGHNTTTEVLARAIFQRMLRALESGALGPEANGVTQIEVTLHESHVAWASYKGDVEAR
jgi:6-pyruvoyl-tetrahydropterin synthase